MGRRKYRQILPAVVILALTVCYACLAKIHYDATEPFSETSELFVHHDGRNYRIPGIICSKKGTILAYCEERKGVSDWSPIDIVCKRSTDRGKSWTEMTLVSGIETGITANNPVMIAGEDGILHFVYETNYGVGDLDGGIWYCRSTDDGVTWSEPVSISEDTDRENRNNLAGGPGHGIVTSDGLLLLPVWISPAGYDPKSSDKPHEAATLYSDDNGTTWHLGERIPMPDQIPDVNECVLTQLSDGTIYLNARTKNADRPYRAVAFSQTGYDGWTELQYDEQLPDPQCMAGLTEYGGGKYLFSNCADTKARRNLTVRISSDGCRTWSEGKMISERGGYSDIAVQEKTSVFSDDRILILHEIRTNTKETKTADIVLTVCNLSYLER